MKKWLKIVIAVGIVGVLALVYVYIFVYNKKHPDFEHLDAAYTLEARNLYQAYRSNKDDAAGKFNGQVLALTGTLSKVETADSLVTLVFVFEQGDFGDEGVRCTMLPKFNADASRLQPDGEVRVKGYCAGYNETDVILEKCSIISE